MNRFPKRSAPYRRAIKLYPKEERLYLGLASLCQYYNSHELGFEIVNVGLRNIPNSARLYSMRGILFIQTSQPEKAMADLSAPVKSPRPNRSGPPAWR